jgi:hypothetical protein
LNTSKKQNNQEPTYLEDIYKFNKQFKDIILCCIKLSIKYHDTWFSQNQVQMEKHLKEYTNQLSDLIKKISTLKTKTTKNLKHEYIKRIKDHKEWGIPKIEENYENNQNQ